MDTVGSLSSKEPYFNPYGIEMMTVVQERDKLNSVDWIGITVFSILYFHVNHRTHGGKTDIR